MQPLATEHGPVERRLVGVRVAQQVLVVVLGADVEAAGEERGRHADLGYEVRRLAEQQRDDSEQHQLCGQAWFVLLRGKRSNSLRAAAVAAETFRVELEQVGKSERDVTRSPQGIRSLETRKCGKRCLELELAALQGNE